MRRIIETRELAADDQLAIRLQSNSAHRTLRARAGIESRIQSAARIETRDPTTRSAADAGERSADHQLSVCLLGDRIHHLPIENLRRETRTQRAIAVDPRQGRTRDAINDGERIAEDRTTDQDNLGGPTCFAGRKSIGGEFDRPGRIGLRLDGRKNTQKHTKISPHPCTPGSNGYTHNAQAKQYLKDGLSNK